MTFAPYLWLLALLPIWAALAGLPLTTASDRRLSAAEVGFLRHGRSGAVAAAVVRLHADGHAAERLGRLARGLRPLPARAEPLPRAVYAAAVTPILLSELPGRPHVKETLQEIERRLAEDGLVPGRVRWWAVRLLPAAVLLVSLVQVWRAGGISMAVLPYLVAIAAAAAAQRVPRRTVAGWLWLARLRRQFNRPPVAAAEAAVGAGGTAGAVPTAGLGGAASTGGAGSAVPTADGEGTAGTTADADPAMAYALTGDAGPARAGRFVRRRGPGRGLSGSGGMPIGLIGLIGLTSGSGGGDCGPSDGGGGGGGGDS